MRWSIIICTHNRAGDLKVNLPFIDLLTYPRDAYEVLVIDNGSDDDTAEVVSAFVESNKSLSYLQEDILGLSHARNCGIAAAKGDYIVFLDDDARPERDWLLQLDKGFQTPSVACVGGRVLPFFTTQKGWPAWLPGRLQGFFTVVNYPFQCELHYPGYPAGTNLALRKTALAEVGPFSISLGRNGESLLSMEEVELCLRIERAGYRILYLPDAIVHHTVNEGRLTRDWVMERCHWQGISAAVLEKEQFPRRKVLIKSLVYLLFILAALPAQKLCAWTGSERTAFFCQCQAILCKSYLKKAWTTELK